MVHLEYLKKLLEEIIFILYLLYIFLFFLEYFFHTTLGHALLTNIDNTVLAYITIYVYRKSLEKLLTMF